MRCYGESTNFVNRLLHLRNSKQLYSLKIADSADSAIEANVEPPSPDGTVAVTAIIEKPGSPSEPIKWRLTASTGTFKIVDVISGGVRLVTLQREVFLAVMRRGGLPHPTDDAIGNARTVSSLRQLKRGQVHFPVRAPGGASRPQLIMGQPEVDGSQLEHGKEVRGVLFVARGKPAEVFDAVEEPLERLRAR